MSTGGRDGQMAQLAIQGPKSESVMQRLVDIKLADIKFYWSNWCTLAGARTLISRTGYTGEDGFEIYFPASAADKVWNEVMTAGQELRLSRLAWARVTLCVWR